MTGMGVSRGYGGGSDWRSGGDETSAGVGGTTLGYGAVVLSVDHVVCASTLSYGIGVGSVTLDDDTGVVGRE